MDENNYLLIKENWDKILENISKKVAKPMYDGMVKPTYPIDLENNILTISTPSEFVREWLDSRYKEQFTESVKSVSENNFEVKFIVQEVVEEKEIPNPAKEKITKLPKLSSNTSTNTTANTTNNNSYNYGNNSSSVLNPSYTFKSYVIGNNNHFSTAAAQKVAESPGRIYNPLFIYGGVGLGKTHLMHSIGNEMIKNSKDIRVAYLSTEKFTNELR